MAWAVRPWLAILAALILIVASGVSTINYFTQETYAKDDFTRLASDLDDRLAPGDLVLVKSPFAWRIFSYYQPKATVNGMRSRSTDTRRHRSLRHAVAHRILARALAFLDKVTDDPRRIWLLVSGTQATWTWTRAWKDGSRRTFSRCTRTTISAGPRSSRIYTCRRYQSTTRFLLPSESGGCRLRRANRLHGYDAGPRPQSDLAIPLTLYWEAATPTDRRYKYLVELVEIRMTASIARSPRSSRNRTWAPYPPSTGTQAKPSSSTQSCRQRSGRAPHRSKTRMLPAHVHMYDAETLEKLPVTMSGDHPVAEDDVTVILPYRPQ